MVSLVWALNLSQVMRHEPTSVCLKLKSGGHFGSLLMILQNESEKARECLKEDGYFFPISRLSVCTFTLEDGCIAIAQ
jgi:hypothetical protein